MKSSAIRTTIVVDGQAGSTFKGKLSARLAKEETFDYSVRVQSIQAGHTIYHEGQKFVMRTMPCAWVNPNTTLVVGPGAFIEWDLLESEINMIENAGYSVRDRLILDERATFVSHEDQHSEETSGIVGKRGSTAEGSGAALVRKLMREDDVVQVKDTDIGQKLGVQVRDTVKMWQDLNAMCSVLVEGAQGTLLSVHTSPYYPFTTSRECTVPGIMSETGLPISSLHEVRMTVRTYPIRVGGNSGPMGGKEISWEELDRRLGTHIEPEITTVTGRQRRIFEFSMEDLQRAISLNSPTYLDVCFIDYINADDFGKQELEDLSRESLRWLLQLQEESGVQIGCVSTGPKEEHIINVYNHTQLNKAAQRLGLRPKTVWS